MTQLEMELQYDLSDREEALSEIYKSTAIKINEQVQASIMQAMNLNKNQMNELLFDLIRITSLATSGVKQFVREDTGARCLAKHPMATYDGTRVMELKDFFQSLMSVPSFVNLYQDLETRFTSVMTFVLMLQEQFFKVNVNESVFIEHSKSWITVTRVVFFDILPKELAQKHQFDSHRPPLLEVPVPWEHNQRGGYILSHQGITKKRGNQEQPENVLRIMNKLQSMAWEYNTQCSFAEEVDFVTKSSAKKLAKSNKNIYKDTLGNMVEARTSTLLYTINLIKQNGVCFFEWRRDSRGRYYPTAYNLNPQGDKYKKGAIRAKSNIYQ